MIRFRAAKAREELILLKYKSARPYTFIILLKEIEMSVYELLYVVWQIKFYRKQVLLVQVVFVLQKMPLRFSLIKFK